MTVSDSAVSHIAVLQILANTDKPSLCHLMELTGLSRATVQRKIRELREIYRMDIQYQRSGEKPGAVGFYLVNDWGIFNKNAIP